MVTLKLLQDYDGRRRGEKCAVDSEADAEILIEQGVAERTVSTDDPIDPVAMAREVADELRAELIGGLPPNPQPGNYAKRQGFGRIDPKKFWAGDSSTVSPADSFGNFAEFCSAVAGADKGHWDERLKDIHSSPNPEGGFLLPSEMVSWIFREAMQMNPLMTRSTLLPMQSSKISVPFIAEASRLATGPHGVGTGLGPPHVAEEGGLVDISPTFGKCTLDLHKIGGLSQISNEMLEDSSMALSVLLPIIFGDALNFRIYEEMINGSGAGECLGLLNAPATVTQVKEDTQAADTILYENIVGMWSRMLPGARDNAIWLANVDCEPQLRQLAIVIGTAGSAVFALNSANGVDRIFGKEVFFTEHCPTLGDEGDVICVDPRAYAIGQKAGGGGIRIESSRDARFENDQTVFRAIARIDAQPLIPNAITPAHGTNTLSHFVKLGERA